MEGRVIRSRDFERQRRAHQTRAGRRLEAQPGRTISSRLRRGVRPATNHSVRLELGGRDESIPRNPVRSIRICHRWSAGSLARLFFRLALCGQGCPRSCMLIWRFRTLQQKPSVSPDSARTGRIGWRRWTSVPRTGAKLSDQTVRLDAGLPLATIVRRWRRQEFREEK